MKTKDSVKNVKAEIIWVLLRMCMSFMMLWAFFDKLFGLGFSTTADKSWLKGVSPTFGFLKFGIHNPFFQSLAGSPLIDWLFMMGLLLIGVALLLGIGLKIAGYSGAVMMLLMWLSLFPPANNPFLDEHIFYALIFIGFTLVPVGNTLGLGKWWSQTAIVKKFPILK
jgi:thiosulfate dehydrogenase [quinone] large subunit